MVGKNATDDWYDGGGGNTWYMDGVETRLNVTNAWHVFILVLPDPANSVIRLGQDRTYSGRNWHGYVAEVCVYDSVLTGEDFTNLNDYLMNKYGIT
jgi:hypothetical protein